MPCWRLRWTWRYVSPGPPVPPSARIPPSYRQPYRHIWVTPSGLPGRCRACRQRKTAPERGFRGVAVSCGALRDVVMVPKGGTELSLHVLLLLRHAHMAAFRTAKNTAIRSQSARLAWLLLGQHSSPMNSHSRPFSSSQAPVMRRQRCSRSPRYLPTISLPVRLSRARTARACWRACSHTFGMQQQPQ